VRESCHIFEGVVRERNRATLLRESHVARVRES